MELERIKRKITALENKNQVNYASVSGTTYSITKNGTELSIDKDGLKVIKHNEISSNEHFEGDNTFEFDSYEEIRRNKAISKKIMKTVKGVS